MSYALDSINFPNKHTSSNWRQFDVDNTSIHRKKNIDKFSYNFDIFFWHNFDGLVTILMKNWCSLEFMYFWKTKIVAVLRSFFEKFLKYQNLKSFEGLLWTWFRSIYFFKVSFVPPWNILGYYTAFKNIYTSYIWSGLICLQSQSFSANNCWNITRNR